MTITLDEFAEIAALKTARMYFPAKTDAESLEMLRAWTAEVVKNAGAQRVDEQQNSVADVSHPDTEGHCQACRANTPGKSPSWLCTARQGCAAMEN